MSTTIASVARPPTKHRQELCLIHVRGLQGKDAGRTVLQRAVVQPRQSALRPVMQQLEAAHAVLAALRKQGGKVSRLGPKVLLTTNDGVYLLLRGAVGPTRFHAAAYLAAALELDVDVASRTDGWEQLPLFDV